MGQRPLRDFIRLAITFFCCLVLLAGYHHIKLYSNGVIDSVINRSFALLLIHHIGFTAITSLLLAFVYSFLERRRAGMGFTFCKGAFILIFMVEALLTEYYVQEYEILGAGITDRFLNAFTALQLGLYLLVFLTMSLVIIRVVYPYTKRSYRLINRMYPFTFILFTFFLATLITGKKPVNENKIQHLVTSSWELLADDPEYAGDAEYPLAGDFQLDEGLTGYFELKETAPDIVLVLVDGLGTQFVGDDAPFKAFMPHLNSLQKRSLYWKNHLSNTAEGHNAFPTVLGSLPFGDKGFAQATPAPGRNTLFSLLKLNNYHTAFYYGGNSALHHYDKFCFEEKVDLIVDNKSFGSEFEKQPADRAGISLGYPDKEVFRKWGADPRPDSGPMLTVIVTQSSKKPFLIPQEEVYTSKAKAILESLKDTRTKKISRKHREVMAGFMYADDALKQFMANALGSPAYDNTIFVITGTHNVDDLPKMDNLDRYEVPLLIFSPMLKSPAVFEDLVSHADLAPSLLGLVNSVEPLNLPGQSAWLGDGLSIKKPKTIPLFRHANGIKDMVVEGHFLSGNRVFAIEERSDLRALDGDALREKLIAERRYFRSVNRYVMAQNKILPDSLSLYKMDKGLSKEEQIWVNSVFSGNDFDRAYNTAKRLAFDGDRERALLLCAHILKNVPGHVDTEVLTGRIAAWNGQYGKAERILKECLRKNPLYADTYAALLDVYYWSGNNHKATELEKTMKDHQLQDADLQEKLLRAYRSVKKDTTAKNHYKAISLEGGISETHFDDL